MLMMTFVSSLSSKRRTPKKRNIREEKSQKNIPHIAVVAENVGHLDGQTMMTERSNQLFTERMYVSSSEEKTHSSKKRRSSITTMETRNLLNHHSESA